jgi:hypothetical protein
MTAASTKRWVVSARVEADQRWAENALEHLLDRLRDEAEKLQLTLIYEGPAERKQTA